MQLRLVTKIILTSVTENWTRGHRVWSERLIRFCYWELNQGPSRVKRATYSLLLLRTEPGAVACEASELFASVTENWTRGRRVWSERLIRFCYWELNPGQSRVKRANYSLLLLRTEPGAVACEANDLFATPEWSWNFILKYDYISKLAQELKYLSREVTTFRS
jgi:hypothetical protein